MTIEILASEVVDQIAAGEVVERPSHMVKELIENSLDAGASEILLEFSQGGRFVKVSDNGSGMDAENLPKAFLRFATSKIKNSEDLWKLSSFGFRGEALASIAAVAKVTVFSSADSSGLGHRMSGAFGRLSPLEPVSRGQGTTVLVEELFQNVPARLKFMKSDSAEAAQIKNIVKAIAMAHWKVEFRILQEGKLLFYWPKAPTQKDRIETVLEISPLYEGRAERGSVQVRSYFSDPHQVSRVSRNLWFYAQNRPIQDRSLQAAVMEAYRNLLMHGEYPFAVCLLETDPGEIDVNIHPTKSQVKFVNPQDSFRAVQGSIRAILEQAPWLKRNEESTIPESVYVDQTPVNFNKNSLELGPVPLEFEDEAFQITQFQTKGFIDPQFRSPANPLHSTNSSNSTSSANPTHVLGAGSSEPSLRPPPSSLRETAPLIRHWSLLQVIGQAGLTYLVCQSEKGLILIDQHAAHERVAFERLMSAWRGRAIEIQEFLFPLSFSLSEEKIEALLKKASEFSQMGIDLEPLGPTTLGIKSAPALIKDQALVQEMERVSAECMEWGDSTPMEKVMGDICARLACHSVLRAGQSLTFSEMQRLLEEMDEYPLSSFCPHGRPVSQTLTWVELEKDFGRRL